MFSPPAALALAAIWMSMLGLASAGWCGGVNASQEEQTKGVAVRICRWYGGKKAALSLRFDDSHPTHVERAIPMLNEYGLIGTFLVNPGNANYQKYKAEWEKTVIQQGHELGDHTLNHSGARTDEEAEQQIGEPAQLLHQVQPELKLIMFLGGGATRWFQRKPVRFFEAKYDVRRPRGGGGSLSCSEMYPSFNLGVFEETLARALANGEWMQAHFHPVIEQGHLFISPQTLRRLLEVVKARKPDLWQAGMSAIYQYRQEREGAALWVHPSGDDALLVDLTCSTDSSLFRQPLTLEVDMPARVRRAEVAGADGMALASRVEQVGRRRVLRFDVAPVDASYAVRARGIGKSYLEANGPDLPHPGAHPYLFFSAGDLPALRNKATDPRMARSWEAIKSAADRLVGEEPASRGRGGDGSWRIRLLGFVYAMTADPRYAQRALPDVERLAADDSWRMPNSQALGTAEATCTLALAYDWLYDALDQGRRARLREAIITKGLEPIMAATEKGEWWTSWFRCNWGSVIYGQAGVAALALLGDDPRAADWARLAARKIWHYTRAVGDDGGWGESGGYAGYAWYRAVLLMDALQRITGGRINLFESPNLRLLPYWWIYQREPNGRNFVPFSDASRGTSGVPEIIFRLAREYQDGRAQCAAQSMAGDRDSGDVFGFLWYDPGLEPKGLDDLPLDKVFRDIDWAFLRSRWEDANGTLFAFKAGQKDWDHQHHDTNHFLIYAYGEQLLADLLYPRKIWGCTTEAHNTIMVNGKDQRGTVQVAGCRDRPEHRGIIDDLFSAPWYARMVGDASLAHAQEEVKSAVREVMYLRKAGEADPPDYFVVFDDISAAAPYRMDWLLHTYGDLALNGDRITIKQGQAALDVTIVAPQPFAHELFEKSLEEVGSEKPFEGADAVRYIKVHPVQPVARGRFLSVLAPRPASTPPSATITSLSGPNLVGASIAQAATTDVALFALDAPEMSGGGVEAVGRSCLVRRAGGKVTAAAIHNGQRLVADGRLLFEVDYSGSAVLTFGEKAIEAKLALYDSDTVRIRCDRRPAKVLVDGAERPFIYEEDQQCVRIDYPHRGDVKILLE